MTHTIAIIGTGQLGCSFAAALKKYDYDGQIIGYDTNPDHTQQALKAGTLDTAASSMQEAVQDADVVLFTPPLPYTKQLMAEAATHAKPDAIFTDVGSAKQHVISCYDALGISQPLVPGHPIAGTEKAGPDATNPTLFRGKPFWITPHTSAEEGSPAYQTVKKLWEKTGMMVGTMTPQEHDHIFATCSHLAQLLSWAYASLLGEYAPDAHPLPRCFYEHIRLGGSDVAMWSGVYACNKDAVLHAIELWLHDSHELMELSDDALQDHLAGISLWRSGIHNLAKESVWRDEEHLSPMTGLLPILLADSYVASLLRLEQELGRPLSLHIGSGMMGVTLPAMHPGQDSHALLQEHDNWRDLLGTLRERVMQYRDLIAEDKLELLSDTLTEARDAHKENLSRFSLTP